MVSLPTNPRARLLSAVVGALMLTAGLVGCGRSASQVQATDGAASSGSSSSTPPAAQSRPAQPPQAPAVDCAVAKCLALTFDDGPSALTPQLLTTFTTHQARATLFMLGQAASLHPQTVRSAFDQGFEIGNHTTDHKMLNSISADQVRFQLRDTQERLRSMTGVNPTVMRPPYAGRNKTSDAICAQLGLAVVIWTDSPSDWVNRDKQTIIDLTLKRARRNAIMLFHDTHTWTVEAMATLVPKLQEQGYTLVTVSELVGHPEPGKLYS